MTDDLELKLAAYLDGQGTPAERRAMEKILAQDKKARRLVAELKHLNERIDSAKPADVPVPDGFRQSVITRLSAPTPDSAGKSGQRGGRGVHRPATWLVMGVVLGGLLATLGYLDSTKGKGQDSAVVRRADTGPLPGQRESGNPSTAMEGLPASSVQEATVQPDVINSARTTAGKSGPDKVEALTGQVYSHGAADVQTHQLKPAITLQPSRTEMEVQPSGSGEAYLSKLEHYSGWTDNEIHTFYQKQKRPEPASSEYILLLARRSNINPALILVGSLNQEDIDQLAGRLRKCLESAGGNSSEQRYRALVEVMRLDKNQEKMLRTLLSFH